MAARKPDGPVGVFALAFMLLQFPSIIGSPALGVISGVTVTEDLVSIEEYGPSLVAANPLTHVVYVTNPTEQKVSVIKQAKLESESNQSSVMYVVATIEVPNAYGVAVNSATNMIYVGGYSQSSVYVINGSTNRITSVITAGSTPRGLAVNPLTNLIYVANFASDTVSIIDGRTNNVTNTIHLSDRDRRGPHALAIDTGNNLLYVANWLSNSVSVIDVSTDQLLEELTGVGANPHTIAILEGKDKVYAASRDSISVIGISEDTKHFISIQFPLGSRGPDGDHQVGSLAVDQDAELVYFTDSAANLTSIIDAEGDVILPTEITNPAILKPKGIAVDAGLDLVYVVGQGSNSLMALDSENNHMHTILISGRPSSIAVNSETGMVYVGGYHDAGTVSIIDGRSENDVTGVLPLGQYVMDVEVNAKSKRVYALLSTVEPDGVPKGTLVVIDSDTNLVVDRISIAALAPVSIAVNSKTDMLYLGHSGYNHHTITVIDGATNSVVDSIDTGYNFPSLIAVNDKSDKLYVAISEPATVLIYDIGGDKTEDSVEPLIVPVSGSLAGIAVNRDNDLVYVTDYWNATMSIIDGRNANLIKTLTGLGQSPTGVSTDEMTGTVYITDSSLNTLMVLDAATNEVTSEIVTDKSPTGLVVDPISQKVFVANAESGTVLKYDENQLRSSAELIPFTINAELVSAQGTKGDTDNDLSHSISGRSQNVNVTSIFLVPEKNTVIINYTSMVDPSSDSGMNARGGIIEIELPHNIASDIYGIWLGTHSPPISAVAAGDDTIWIDDYWEDEEYYLKHPSLGYAYIKSAENSTKLKIIVPLEDNSVELWATNIVPEFGSLFYIIALGSIFSSIIMLSRSWRKYST